MEKRELPHAREDERERHTHTHALSLTHTDLNS